MRKMKFGMRKAACLLVAAVLVMIVPALLAAPPEEKTAVELVQAEAANYRASAHLFKDHTPESFAKTRPPQQAIDPQKVDLDLLAAAVFHETNRRRAEHEFKRLEYLPALRKAAAVQAEIMMKKGAIKHVNPERPKLRGPTDRYRAFGLDPRFLAENVATIFGLDYRSGSKVYVEMEDGARHFTRTPGGAPIEMRTYLGFARTLLTEWMNSPHHRANILQSKARYLGCSCRAGKNAQGFHTFYCAQEFYTAMPTSR